ncbi:MAG: PQQ-dependent sugar dehydrogenase [Polyangiales bacterium]
MRFLTACTIALAVSGPAVASAQTLAAGAPATTFDATQYATGLGQLTDFKFLPDGRVIAIEKAGTARVRDKTSGMWTVAATFPVSTTSEQGLLGVEVHPNFATNKLLFFYYSANAADGGSDLDRHRVVSIPLKDDGTLDMASEKVLLKGLRGPANHDGGALTVLGDKLFVGVGDTGCNCSCKPGDNMNNWFATCLTNANGKILRINFDGSIPADNPLVGKTVTKCGDTCGVNISTTGTSTMPRTEIWAWGFRNPFRIWGDPVSKKLWVGDVGEITWEEINVVDGNHHYGWPRREGTEGQPATWCTTITPNTGNCVDPVYACPRSDCQTIIGGRIMDSCDWPTSFRGLYFFADDGSNKIFTLKPNATRDGVVAGSRADFADMNGVTSLQMGPDGALYAGAISGKIEKFAVKAPVVCDMPDAGPDTGPDTGTTDTGTTPSDTGTTPEDSAVTDDASTGADSSATDDGGANPDTTTADSGGCGCEVPGTSTASRHGLFALALVSLGAAISRRRRR